jgi:hypothetical protein
VAALTISEAARWLDPPITAKQLGGIVRALGIEPCGRRRLPSGPGRPLSLYDAQLLIDLHSAIIPFLRDTPRRTSSSGAA